MRAKKEEQMAEMVTSREGIEAMATVGKLLQSFSSASICFLQRNTEREKKKKIRAAFKAAFVVSRAIMIRLCHFKCVMDHTTVRCLRSNSTYTSACLKHIKGKKKKKEADSQIYLL